MLEKRTLCRSGPIPCLEEDVAYYGIAASSNMRLRYASRVPHELYLFILNPVPSDPYHRHDHESHFEEDT